MINKVYEDQYFYYFWKEHGLATTFGKQKSFLDFFNDIIKGDFKNINSSAVWVVFYLNNVFGADLEYGLLNRLDNDTAGLLYFAKSMYVYKNYKLWQSKGKLTKTYIADVKGDFKYEQITIQYPIMHHKYLNNKMIVIKTEKDFLKGRGKAHFQKTYVKKLFYDKDKNYSCLQIIIQKGVRHQIRVHLNSIGYPIIGDKIYGNDYFDKKLHLRSVGLNLNL